MAVSRDELAERLPDALRLWRFSNGLSQAEAAEVLGVFWRTLQEWEAGRAFPRGRNLLAVQKILADPLPEMKFTLPAVATRTIYFAQRGVDGPIKIGSTLDLERRLKQLQAGFPEAIRLLGTIGGSLFTERAIHADLDSQRVSGEWYHPTPEVLSFIEERLQQEAVA